LLIERPYPEQNPYRLKDHHSPYLFVHPGGDEKKKKNDELGAGSNYLAGAVRLPFVRVLHACKKCTIIYACAALARHIIEQKR